MFQKILAPVDLTDRHGPALEAAAELARQSGGEVLLLHVIEAIPSLGPDQDPHFYNRLEKLARAHVARLGELLQDREVPCRGEVQVGRRALDVVRFAREQAVDLIVLTAPRPDPDIPAIGWGSLSYKVGLLAPCPVLLVK